MHVFELPREIVFLLMVEFCVVSTDDHSDIKGLPPTGKQRETSKIPNLDCGWLLSRALSADVRGEHWPFAASPQSPGIFGAI